MSFVYEYGRVQSQFSKGIMLVSLNGVNDCTTMARMQSTETVDFNFFFVTIFFVTGIVTILIFFIFGTTLEAFVGTR